MRWLRLLAPGLLRRRDRLLLAAAIGTVSSGLIVGWLALTGFTPGVGAAPGLLLILVGGAAAALVCAAIAEAFEPHRPISAAGPG